jgi:hypothetical protein
MSRCVEDEATAFSFVNSRRLDDEGSTEGSVECFFNAAFFNGAVVTIDGEREGGGSESRGPTGDGSGSSACRLKVSNMYQEVIDILPTHLLLTLSERTRHPLLAPQSQTSHLRCLPQECEPLRRAVPSV